MPKDIILAPSPRLPKSGRNLTVTCRVFSGIPLAILGHVATGWKGQMPSALTRWLLILFRRMYAVQPILSRGHCYMFKRWLVSALTVEVETEPSRSN